MEKYYQCIYCNMDIAESEAPESEIPTIDDNDRWARLAEIHGTNCEWVVTRAHRVDYDYSFEPRECRICGEKLQWDGEQSSFTCGPH